MRRTALLLALALCGCVASLPPPPLTGDGSPTLAPRGPKSAADQALELSLKRHPGGATWRLSQERGSVVLLDVWASWCEPCRDSLPLYQDFAKEYGARGLKVYAVNVDADPREIEKFLQETHVTLPVLVDPEARVSEAQLKVKMMPTTFLIDRRGVVRHVHEGFAEEFMSKYMADIEGLLAEPAQ